MSPRHFQAKLDRAGCQHEVVQGCLVGLPAESPDPPVLQAADPPLDLGERRIAAGPPSPARGPARAGGDDLGRARSGARACLVDRIASRAPLLDRAVGDRVDQAHAEERCRVALGRDHAEVAALGRERRATPPHSQRDRRGVIRTAGYRSLLTREESRVQIQDRDPPAFVAGTGSEPMQDHARCVAKTGMQFNERPPIRRLSLGSRSAGVSPQGSPLRGPQLIQARGKRVLLMTRRGLDGRHDGREEIHVLAGRPGAADTTLVVAGHAGGVIVHRPEAITRMPTRIAGEPFPGEQIAPAVAVSPSDFLPGVRRLGAGQGRPDAQQDQPCASHAASVPSGTSSR